MSQIYLPDPLSNWPFPHKINPHYSSVKLEAEDWIHGLNILDQETQRAFDKCDFVLSAALVYPSLDAAYTDIIIGALEHPQTATPAQERGSGVRGMARQFWARAITIAPATAQRRFIATFTEYIKSVALEAQDRKDDYIRSIDSYLSLRRKTVGGYLALFPIELCVDIPDNIMQHPALAPFADFLPESSILLNDMYSFNIEQAAGHHAHNLVTVVMHEKNISMQESMHWIGRYHVQHLSRFESLKASLPTWGAEMDRDVAVYVEGIAQCIRGLDTWSFETQRYFGSHGKQVRQTRLLTLLPKVNLQLTTPMTVLEAVPKAQDAPIMSNPQEASARLYTEALGADRSVVR